MGWLGVLGVVVPILVVIAVCTFVGFAYFKIRYKTAKSNEALIITGRKLGGGENVFTDGEGRAMKIVRGGGHFLKPGQLSTPVDLTSFLIRLTTPKVNTNGGVPVIADAVATVTVSGTKEGIVIYAEQFLGKKPAEVEAELTEVLGANLRALLSKMTVEEINANRDKFSQEVTRIAQEQLGGMGFNITSLGLTDLRDADPQNGYISNLGRPLIAKAKREAETAEANSDKEIRIYRANANKEAEDEEIKRQTDIAESKKKKDLAEAEILEETERARAKAEQSYELERTKLEKQVQEESLKLVAQKKEEELRIQQLERQRQVAIEEEQSKIRKAKADADFYETTRIAEADAKKAEIDGLAQAKIKRETGLADAEVILKRGQAEAESRRLFAEAIAENGDIIIAEKLIEMLPKYAEKIAQPLSNIDSVKIIDTGNGNGIASFGKSITQTMVELQEPLKELTGMDVTKLLTDLVNRGNTHTTVITPDERTTGKQSERNTQSDGFLLQGKTEQIEQETEVIEEDNIADEEKITE